jgi:hypothetical protein
MLNSDTESALRSAYARATGEIDIPTAVTERLAGHEYHPRGTRPGRAAGALAAAGVIATGAVAGAHALGAGPQHTTIHLASYSLKLPSQYTPESTGSAACDPYGGKKVIIAGRGFTQTPEPAIAAAADQAGGCVSITLSPAFTPAAPDAPLRVSVSSAGGLFQGHPVEVDGSRGWVGAGTFTSGGTQQDVLVLFVPAPGGQVQDFMVVATGMSDAELVSIVSSGLSVPSQPSATTTALVATTTLPPSATTSSPVTTISSPATTTVGS